MKQAMKPSCAPAGARMGTRRWCCCSGGGAWDLDRLHVEHGVGAERAHRGQWRQYASVRVGRARCIFRQPRLRPL